MASHWKEICTEVNCSANNEKCMEKETHWLKRHADTVVIMSGILGSFLWMSGKFGDIDKRFSIIEQRLVRIETVLIMQGIMPHELAIKDEK